MDSVPEQTVVDLEQEPVEEEEVIVNTFDAIFDYVPLSERIDSGLGDFYETILKQRDLAKKAAATSSGDGVMPPEMRFGKISSNRKV